MGSTGMRGCAISSTGNRYMTTSVSRGGKENMRLAVLCAPGIFAIVTFSCYIEPQSRKYRCTSKNGEGSPRIRDLIDL